MSAIALAPLQFVLDRIVRGFARRQPSVFDRLGRHCASSYLIDPVNLPIVLLLKPQPLAPTLRAAWRSSGETGDCRIAGSFATLLALIDGRRDGDALFFSRDLTVEGDIDAVVTLRNALDDLDVSPVQDIVNSAGLLRKPLAAVIELLRALDRQEAGRAS